MNISGKILEENPPYQPNPSRSALASVRPNIADCLSDASARDKNIYKCMATYEPLMCL